jgi:nucleotide-binding universal stress UspA family protein
MIKSIIVPYVNSHSEGTLQSALALAARVQAHVIVLVAFSVPVPIPDVWHAAPYDTFLYMREQALASAKAVAERMRLRCEAVGTPVEVRVVEALASSAATLAAFQARYADLSIVPAAAPDRDAAIAHEYFSELLFHSGRPVLVVPKSRLGVTDGHKDSRLGVTDGHKDSRLGVTDGHKDSRLGVTDGHKDSRLGVTDGHKDSRLGVTDGHKDSRLGVTDEHKDSRIGVTDGHKATKALFEQPKRVVIAWQPTRETTRAVHDAMPFLRAADCVDVVVVDPEVGETAHGPDPGTDIATQLARHGLRVNVVQLPRAGTSVACVINDYVRQSNSDLLIAGGYGHSRLREFLLGGVTRELLSTVTVPTLFSH